MEIAKKEDKPLFLFFTGSDWCGWCIRLQKEVFKTPEFEAWAKEKSSPSRTRFSQRKSPNRRNKNTKQWLANAFHARFPTVWFAKADNKAGKINFEQLGSTGYVAGGPSVWLAGADQIIAKFVPSSKAGKRINQQNLNKSRL